MRLLRYSSAVLSPAMLRADTNWDPLDDRWYVPHPWLTELSAAGVTVTPDLAMTLSAFYSGVTMIGRDIATLPLQVHKVRDDGGKDRVRPIYGRGIDASNGIGSMAYMLRWQPNDYQTATEFWMGMIAQYLLRGKAYAEIIEDLRTGFVVGLVPRHPDRITPERLPSGTIRYKLIQTNGEPRWLTQREMFVIRDLALDGLNSMSRVQYGAQTIGTILAAEQAAGKFFQSGMTASTVVTYKGGQMDDEDEVSLHTSLSRYAAGARNNFGLLVVPDEIDVKTLGIEPEKAQMMLAREWGVREVARQLNLPGAKLGIKDSVSYASQTQAALDYVITCLRPIAVTFEQAIQRDLILAKDTYFGEFLLAALLRGDFESQANYIEKLIRNRVMWSSEARLILNMNPDEKLDELLEKDFRPGDSGGATSKNAAGQNERMQESRASSSQRAQVKGLLMLHDSAVRCLRRERAAVEKLAKWAGENVEKWKTDLREFYADHARFVAQTMRLAPVVARAYAAQHGTEVEAKGVPVFSEEWERYEADELVLLALDDERMAA